jgi:4-hydroxybenzoate polyprenyltransferase
MFVSGITGIVAMSKHFLILSCVGLIYCVAILTFYNSINLLLGIIAGLGLATYTTFKRKWWAGPFYNSWIVSVLFLMNLFASTTISFYEINLTIGLTLVAVFFGYSNFVLVGYFKDIDADEQTGYNTLPVVFGRKISTMISNIFALIVVFTTIIIFFITAAQTEFIQLIPASAFLMAAVITTLYTQWQLRQVMYDEEAYKAVSPSVHSYLLTLSSITSMNKPSWSIFALLFYMAFIAVMKIRPTKSQI